MIVNKRNGYAEWFDIDKYNIFNELSDCDLLNQLIVRRDYLFYGVQNDGAYFFLEEFEEIRDEFYAKIFSDVIRPLDSSTWYRNNMKTKKYTDMQLSATSTVTPLQVIDVKKMEGEVSDYINKNNIRHSLRGQKASINKIKPYFNEMHITLDMENPDDILLEDIKKLLPEWRKELDFNHTRTSDSISGSWGVVKRKILDYKIIPIIDLICWGNITRKRITNKKIAQLVFPYGEYDSTNIVQTIKPFIENLMRDFSIEKYQRLIK